MNEINQNQQLTQAIHALTNALAASERRIQTMERLFRYLGVAVLLLAAVVLLPRTGTMIGTAQASSQLMQELGINTTDVDHFHNILTNLDTILTTVVKVGSDQEFIKATKHTLTNLDTVMSTTASLANNPEFAKNAKTMFTNLNTMLDKTASLANNQKFIGSASNTLSNIDTLLAKTIAVTKNPEVDNALKDLFILATRFKQDSDMLRFSLKQSLTPAQAQFIANFLQTQKSQGDKFNELVQNTSPSLDLMQVYQGIQSEIHFVNGNLQAMAHSMDSTMGRMGRMMSPFPMPFGY